jgi:hypothetical protein
MAPKGLHLDMPPRQAQGRTPWPHLAVWKAMCSYGLWEGHDATWPFEGPCGHLALKAAMWPPGNLGGDVLIWPLGRPRRNLAL